MQRFGLMENTSPPHGTHQSNILIQLLTKIGLRSSWGAFVIEKILKLYKKIETEQMLL